MKHTWMLLWAACWWGCSEGQPLSQEDLAPSAGLLPPLPEKANALGAAVLADQLYVLGGHVGGAHESSIDNFLPHFRRLALSRPERGWEARRAPGPPLQQAVLFTYNERLYRLGGLTARNRADQPKDLYTTDTFAVYDEAGDRWQELAPMPSTRASHSVTVIGGVVYVFGGWQLSGGAMGTYHRTWLEIDLKAQAPAWKVHEQPFQVRDHCAAAVDGKVYVLGGMLSGTFPSRAQVYDPADGQLRDGPALPGGSPVRGFGCAAVSTSGTAVYSAADGAFRLNPARDGWTALPPLQTPRSFHALVVRGPEELIAVGGAIDLASTPTDSLELIRVR